MIITPFAFMATAGPSYDADAQAFFTAVEGGGDTLTTTEKDATNQLVLDLKADSIWSKLQVIYPMVGGTASAMKWNLADPRDLDAAYRIGWTATNWTFDSNGAQAADTIGEYGDTNYAGDTNDSGTGMTMALYINGGTNAAGYDLGANLATSQPTGQEVQIVAGYGANRLVTRYGYSGASTGYDATMPTGFMASTGNSTATLLYIDGVQVVSNGTARNVATSAQTNLYLGNRSDNTDQPTDRRYAFVGIGEELTSTNHSDLYTAVQAFQTSLSRQN